MRLSGRKLLIATKNRSKLKEIQEVLGDLPLDLIGLDEIEPEPAPVEESGESYAANALLKARSVVGATGLAALADDSGLEVDALGGAPGTRSARFAGLGASDEANNQLLLARLAGVPAERRTARFVCTAALVLPVGNPIVTSGAVEGRILEAPRGSRGFGYDPLFYHEPFGCTFGEADPADKNRVSHRGQAFRTMATQLRALL